MRPGAMKIVHYTSHDLKHWRFAEIARSSPVAYDSDVFRVGARDGYPAGSWLLFSTMQGRSKSDGMAKPLQSTNLFNWSECNDKDELINVGEVCPGAPGVLLGWRQFASRVVTERVGAGSARDGPAAERCHVPTIWARMAQLGRGVRRALGRQVRGLCVGRGNRIFAQHT